MISRCKKEKKKNIVVGMKKSYQKTFSDEKSYNYDELLIFIL